MKYIINFTKAYEKANTVRMKLFMRNVFKEFSTKEHYILNKTQNQED